MDPFAQAIEQWHDFYIMAGSAAATLSGLLFVGLSLNLDWIRRRENTGLSQLAQQTFTNFLYVLFFAIVFLVPDQDPSGIGIPLLMMGVVGLLESGRFMVTELRRRSPWGGFSFIFWRAILPTVAFLILVGVSVLAFQGDAHGLNWMIAVIVILLLISARNSWDLLVRVRDQGKT